MKKLAFLLSCLIMLISCEREEQVPPLELGVDVQASFEGDHVLVSLNDEIWIDQELQTNHLLGVCHIVGQRNLRVDPGNYLLSVTINDTITSTETFVMTRNHYIGVQFDRDTQEISFVHSEEMFGYD